MELNDDNIFTLLYVVLSRKQRDTIFYDKYHRDAMSDINNRIHEVVRHGMRDFTRMRTLVTIKKLNVVTYFDRINGQDIDGYGTTYYYFQVSDEHNKHFIRNRCIVKQNQLMSQSFWRIVQHKLESKHHSLLYAINLRTSLNYTSQSDRNFHLRKDGNLSLLPKGRQSIVNSDNKWTVDGRTTIKMGKGIKKLFDSANIDSPLDDTQLEELVTNIKSDFIFNGKISVVKGKEITYWYNGCNYASGQATLSSSCMRHDNCESFIEFYAKNDNASMIIATDNNNHLLGRAIVWSNAEFTDNDDNNYTNSFCDRIYGKPLTIKAIQAFALEHGHICKLEQDYHSEESFLMPNGTHMRGTVSIEVIPHDFYPYMDTMKSIDIIAHDKAILYNNSDYKELTGTDGNNDDEDWVTDIDGERLHVDDTVYSEHHGEYLNRDYAVYSDSMSSYISEGESETLHNGAYCLTDDARQVTLPNGLIDYEYYEYVIDGSHNIEDCTISEYWDISTDVVLDQSVYSSMLNSVTITRVRDNKMYIFEVDTTVTEEYLADQSFDDLTNWCNVTIIPDDTNAE